MHLSHLCAELFKKYPESHVLCVQIPDEKVYEALTQVKHPFDEELVHVPQVEWQAVQTWPLPKYPKLHTHWPLIYWELLLQVVQTLLIRKYPDLQTHCVPFQAEFDWHVWHVPLIKYSPVTVQTQSNFVWSQVALGGQVPDFLHSVPSR